MSFVPDSVITEVQRDYVFCGGSSVQYSHYSQVLHCVMHFTLFKPGTAHFVNAPLLWYLADKHQNDQHIVTHVHAMRKAQELNIALISPDVSPRFDIDEPEGDLPNPGWGASWYLDVPTPEHAHYRMFTYLTEELQQVLRDNSMGLDLSRQSVMGHGMGGHGALLLGLKTNLFGSISAFGPYMNPSVDWRPTLANWLVSEEDWQANDTLKVLEAQTNPPPILLDFGGRPREGHVCGLEALKEFLVNHPDVQLQLNVRDAHDSGIYLVNSFVEEHLDFHAGHLNSVSS